MRKIAAWGVVIIFCVLLFGAWVYPTPYQYVEYSSGDYVMTVRINRFTGETFLLTPNLNKWTKIANSWTD